MEGSPEKEKHEILTIAWYMQPICPYNRYLNDKQRLMMEQLGYTDLQPCLREQCKYYEDTTEYHGASTTCDQSLPMALRPIGLSANRVIRCNASATHRG